MGRTKIQEFSEKHRSIRISRIITRKNLMLKVFLLLGLSYLLLTNPQARYATSNGLRYVADIVEPEYVQRDKTLGERLDNILYKR